MPGKRGQSRFSWVSSGLLYRELTAADTGTSAGAAAVTEEIDLTVCDYAVGNRLDFQVIVPSGVAQYDLELWGTFSTDIVGVGVTLWAKLDHLFARKSSSFMTSNDVPCAHLKLLLTNVTGSFDGPCLIYCSRTA